MTFTNEAAVTKFKTDATKLPWIIFYCVGADGSFQSSRVSDAELLEWLEQAGGCAGFVGCVADSNRAVQVIVRSINECGEWTEYVNGITRLMKGEGQEVTVPPMPSCLMN